MRASRYLPYTAAVGILTILFLVGGFAMLWAFDQGPGYVNPIRRVINARVMDAIVGRTNLTRFAQKSSQLPQEKVASVIDPNEFTIVVNVEQDVHPISDLIYGVSAANPDYLERSGATLNNWGGNTSTRYNWELGNAWNAGRDWQYRNGNYGHEEGNVADQFLREAADAGVSTRLSIPTLGWVARNDLNDTCSFPLPNGDCSDGYGATCDNPDLIADPTLANVRSDSETVRRWLQYLNQTHGRPIDIVAMDNEPELWGYTHYDVHPNCTTYDEILSKYITYAEVVREEMPEAALAGPVTCCWFYYWNSAAGRGDKWAHGNQDFLPWFLTQMREYDDATGTRLLDILDIHYYPTDGLFNHDVSDRVSARRLRSTRSLWDESYRDESWIGQPIYLIPRMQQLINEYYPGTRFGLSEWNFGAEESINGALAIADTLGIFGREDLHFATYWTHPRADTPGFFVFKLFRNYDDNGAHFGDISVLAESEDHNRISSYAAVDSATGNLHIVLINKQPNTISTVTLALESFAPDDNATIIRYSAEQIDALETIPLRPNADGQFEVTLPTYSISHIIIPPGN